LVTSACALIVIPSAAWSVMMLLTPALRGMKADPRWQAPLSAAAAALPGFLFALLGAVSLRDGWASECLHFATGRALYAAIAVVTVFGLIRAIALAYRRRSEIQRLLAASVTAGWREGVVAERLGLRVRRVHSEEPFVLLAGVRRPTVLISSEALRRLDDAQLDAAIRHEAAHARHGDQLVAALVTFIGDLVPLPVAPLVSIYRSAREFAADQAAALESDPCDLASALLALAQARFAPAGTAAFVERATVGARLAALLADSPQRPARSRRIVVTAILLATLVVGAAPAIVALVAGIHCNEVM
jgi:beta-lactamase regulating signal transducer with metallopeptidase domain